MELKGGCRCGAVRYTVSGKPKHVALCHCQDCRRSAGAPMVSWAAYAEADFTLNQGEPVAYNSSGTAWRSFCGKCGTGLYYRNAVMLPGIVDIQSVTLDDPDSLPPRAQIQVADRLHWMETLPDLPEFEHYPG